MGSDCNPEIKAVNVFSLTPRPPIAGYNVKREVCSPEKCSMDS